MPLAIRRGRETSDGTGTAVLRARAGVERGHGERDHVEHQHGQEYVEEEVLDLGTCLLAAACMTMAPPPFMPDQGRLR